MGRNASPAGARFSRDLCLAFEQTLEEAIGEEGVASAAARWAPCHTEPGREASRSWNSWNPHDFGLSRAISAQTSVEGAGGLGLHTRRTATGRAIRRGRHVDGSRPRVDVTAMADMTLRRSGGVVRLRRKDVLPRVAAEAEVPSPATILADGDAAVREAGLRPPMVVKAVEGQEFALTFGQKAVVTESVDDALAVAQEARDRGFQTIIQEVVPDSHERVYSLLAYVARDGRPLVTLVGRKVRQGPLRFGTSAVFEVDYQPTVLEQGLRLLETAGYTGIAHVEFAQDPRDGAFRVLEVNTRLPVWAALAENRPRPARIASDDLSPRVAYYPLHGNLTVTSRRTSTFAGNGERGLGLESPPHYLRRPRRARSSS